MLYKEIACPECNGRGYIAGVSETSMWTKMCDNCHGSGVVATPMTNGDVIRACDNEELVYIYSNLKQCAIYSGGENNRLLSRSPEDLLLWINKETDDIDLRTIFDFINKTDYENPHLKTTKITEV